MIADLLVCGISELVTPVAAGPVHGAAMSHLRVLKHAAIAVRNGHVAWVGPESDWAGVAEKRHHCRGRAVVPALIDPHTHAVWAGNRLPDFEARASRVSYEEILAAGGGIRSTIRHTAGVDLEGLVRLTKPRIEALRRSGAAVIEVKSGYGFEPEAELRMLEAIKALAAETRARLVPTLLIHIPPAFREDRDPYRERVEQELIPEVAHRKLAAAVDVFVEREAWSASEAESMIRCAHLHGLAAKLHTEQFHRVGGFEMGIRNRVLSVDHLEACAPDQLGQLAGSETVATILPGVTLHLGIPAAPGRALIDAGAAVAVGTDLNPGSSPLFSTSMALALAVRLNGLTPAEALSAGTVNAAAALGLTDCGWIDAGTRADFLVLKSADWRDIVYSLGRNAVLEVWIAGERSGA